MIDLAEGRVHDFDADGIAKKGKARSISKPLVPNAETIEAMEAAHRGELTTVEHPSELLTSLNTPDEHLAGANEKRPAPKD